MKKIKAKTITLFLVFLATLSLTFIVILSSQVQYQRGGIKAPALIHQQQFYVFENNRMRPFFMKGVNMGAATVSHFPGELAITKEAYLRYFEMIYAMNANTIRVYTTMKPHFYEALSEFNQGKKNPLYLVQGVWLDEDLIKLTEDAYANNELLLEQFVQDAKDLVDIVHGNSTLADRPGFASGTYHEDVSSYIVAWMIGVEWDPDFVHKTNELNPGKEHYDGQHLKTQDASPFEGFLARVMDQLLDYEMKAYSSTRPISFVNWLTTDPLHHDNEPDIREDFVSVDFEHILLKKSAFGGYFASYHVYPYYPEFINYQSEYTSYIDHRGEFNPYLAYLNALIDYHTIPVVIAEFGLPSSRGKAHDSFREGMNQGNRTEQEQGLYLQKLIEDIVVSKAAGALLFSWQDEWFKRTWNTMDYDLPWRRPFWSNVETNEQMFGLLSYDPGENEMDIHLDGLFDDWLRLGFHPDSQSVFLHHDARYLYIGFPLSQSFTEQDEIVMAISTLDERGSTSFEEQNITFSKPTNFVIRLNHLEGTFYVESRYNPTTYLYAHVLNLMEPTRYLPTLLNHFEVTTHVLSNELYLPKTGQTIPFSTYQSGHLVRGYSNPSSTSFNSLSDYQINDRFVEVRIPWLLLNFMDPSTKQIMAAFQGSTFQSQTMEMFYVAAGVRQNNALLQLESFISYTWEDWHDVVVHERLKASYFYVKESFQSIK